MFLCALWLAVKILEYYCQKKLLFLCALWLAVNNLDYYWYSIFFILFSKLNSIFPLSFWSTTALKQLLKTFYILGLFCFEYYFMCCTIFCHVVWKSKWNLFVNCFLFILLSNKLNIFSLQWCMITLFTYQLKILHHPHLTSVLKIMRTLYLHR